MKAKRYTCLNGKLRFQADEHKMTEREMELLTYYLEVIDMMEGGFVEWIEAQNV